MHPAALQADVILEENAKDDKEDADGDGIADVKQMDGRKLLIRKMRLVGERMEGMDAGWMRVMHTICL